MPLDTSVLSHLRERESVDDQDVYVSETLCIDRSFEVCCCLL